MPNTYTLVWWHDKRVVSLLTTIHKDIAVNMERQFEVVQKPLAIVEYNKYMGGVQTSY